MAENGDEENEIESESEEEMHTSLRLVAVFSTHLVSATHFIFAAFREFGVLWKIWFFGSFFAQHYLHCSTKIQKPECIAFYSSVGML